MSALQSLHGAAWIPKVIRLSLQQHDAIRKTGSPQRTALWPEDGPVTTITSNMQTFR